MSPLNDTEQRAIAAVLDRAASDREFRQRLLDHPHEAILDACGITIPPSFRIRFIERGPDIDALVVLPDLVEEAALSGGGELTDDELEAVTGGAQANANLAWSKAVVIPKGAIPPVVGPVLPPPPAS